MRGERVRIGKEMTGKEMTGKEMTGLQHAPYSVAEHLGMLGRARFRKV